jgi:hypothetical protein
VLIESWRRHYNALTLHSSHGYRPPLREAILPPGTKLEPGLDRPASGLAGAGVERTGGIEPRHAEPRGSTSRRRGCALIEHF